ncbi:MAG: hypothetical protein EZS28_029527 [Streblomastix strix]|uniref:Uncharacterized protein n=1 Tax=Streblomastix strix TaxID=222440 RepID=A0A5J4UW60_9EUKA|nr:MAG: hypothetical protein EZS28_029527 [Streblomastix strix]
MKSLHEWFLEFAFNCNISFLFSIMDCNTCRVYIYGCNLGYSDSPLQIALTLQLLSRRQNIHPFPDYNKLVTLSKATLIVVVSNPPSQTTFICIELSVFIFINTLLSSIVFLSIVTFAPFKPLIAGYSNVRMVDPDI